jgi:hypothetical protein
MMAPLQAPSALKEACVWFGADDATVLAGDWNILTNESSCEGPTDCVVNINPDSTSV